MQLPDWVCVSLHFPRHLSFVARTLAPVFSLVWLFGDTELLFWSRLVFCWGCCPCFSPVWFTDGVAAPVLVSSGSLVGLLPLFLIDVRLYSAILRSLEQTHCARMLFYMSDWLSIARFLNIHRSGVLTALAWLVPHETAAVSAQVLCTPYNHVPCHFMQSHVRKVYACLAVTCHLHFWQNDRDLLRATAVTRGWNGYRNKSQHRKSTLEKKISPVAPAGIRTRDLSVTSPAL